MVYEIKQGEVHLEQWEEMKQIVKRNVCAECGEDLQIHTNPENKTIEVGCLNRNHHGYMERQTYTQAFRRGEAIHPVIQAAIEKKMIPKDELGRAMNLLALRYPAAIKDTATAALFIIDCARLDLDPLISPAEAVPVPFKSTKKKDGKVLEEKVTIQMVITEDGWLSMAARGCKEDWAGPPTTMRLEEYLTSLPENKGRSRKEIATIAREIKEDDCGDPEAWHYAAIGKSKGMTEDAVTFGWFTHKDLEKAVAVNLPAAQAPGNQARVRAIKRWVRQVFPECRQNMKEMTAEWFQRAEGIQAAEEFIDAEYRLIVVEEEDKKDVGATEKPAAKSQAAQGQLPLAEQTRPPHVDEELAKGWQAAKAAIRTARLTPGELIEYFNNKHHIIVTQRDFLQPWPSSKFDAKMLGQFVDYINSLS